MKTIDLKRRALLLAGGSLALTGPMLATAQSKYVKILVGFPAGQATDTVARLIAEKLTASTGVNHIVENKPGAGGSLAMGLLAKAPKDGSVMMLTHMSAVATTPFVIREAPYDSTKDFASAGLVGDLPFMLVCNPSMPFKTVKEMVAYAKAHPDELTNASSGNGTVSHLAMEEFKRSAGIKIRHIPYKGSSADLTDVMAGNCSMALETATSVQGFVQSGKLRLLGAGTPKRMDAPLNVATMAEQGYPDLTAATWLMFIYPAGTPKPIVQSTFDAVHKIVGDPVLAKKMVGFGCLPRLSDSPEQADAYIRTEYKKWGEVVKRSGVTPD
ncbi:MAG: extra-cytoplasmic solute receptor family protein 71 [Herminiimonas sp.]|nr:extra-cytoplasmic solute receptor family protein 71 [Herminiimonas sp.]